MYQLYGHIVITISILICAKDIAFSFFADALTIFQLFNILWATMEKFVYLLTTDEKLNSISMAAYWIIVHNNVDKMMEILMKFCPSGQTQLVSHPASNTHIHATGSYKYNYGCRIRLHGIVLDKLFKIINPTSSNLPLNEIV